MLITYRPDGGDERTWSYKPSDLPYEDAERLEDLLDITFEEFRAKVVRGGLKARRALLWLLLRRENPKLRFTDVQLKRTGELVVEWDSEEIAKMRADTLDATDLEEADRDAFLETLDRWESDGTSTPAEVAAGPKESPAPSTGSA